MTKTDGSTDWSVILEQLGVLAPTWQIVDGVGLWMTGDVFHLGGAPMIALLVAGNTALIVVNTAFGHSLAKTRRDAQRRLEIQAWHLRQLLPVEAPRTRIAPLCM